jgi:GDPmannose 4,6-dehydratase
MWKMLTLEKPDDFVLGTGETHTVREFIETAFEYTGLEFDDHIRIDPRYFRPTEVEVLRADPTKAKEKLGWEARLKFKDLTKVMVDSDMRAAGLEPVGEGDKAIKRLFPHRWWSVD